MPAACAALRGCGADPDAVYFCLALAWRMEDDLLELALDGELAVVDVQLAADAVLEEQEAQLVDRHRVLGVRARLEIADRHRPGRERIEPLGVLQLAAACGCCPGARRRPMNDTVS